MTGTPAGTTSLVVQTSFLGDVVLTTPLIAALAARGPVDVVATPGGATLLEHDPRVRRVVVYDKRGRHAGIGGLIRLAREVRAPTHDSVAYLAQGSWRSAALAVLSGYKRRVGFATSAGRWLYTERVPYRRERHHAERLWGLAVGAESADPAPPPRLYPGDDNRRVIDDLLAAPAARGETLIAIAPGSAWATKRWPFFADLARRLTTMGRMVIVGSASDSPLAREINDATFGAAIDATGKLSLLASAALIGRCRLLVTNDSAPQHLASAMGTPTVTLFGPTVPSFGFGPLAPGSVALGVEELTCRPCSSHGPSVCPLGHWRCMRDLDVDRVAAAVFAIVERGSR